MKILYGRKVDGGLGLTNFRIKEKALKLQWVIQIDKNSLFEELAYCNMQSPGQDLIWDCNMEPRDVEIVLGDAVSKFWKDVVVEWARHTFFQPGTAGEVRAQILWNNSHIKVGTRPVFTKVGITLALENSNTF